MPAARPLAVAAIIGALAAHRAAVAAPAAAYTVVILSPTGFTSSVGRGAALGGQVGYGTPAGAGSHALLWGGSSDDFVDLTPAGGGYAFATDGTRQVGEADAHAALWTGTADSLVDLHPAGGWEISDAYGVGGGQQVGSAFSPTTIHAMLWSGTAQSAVDLHPVGFSQSVALGTNGSYQVGYGYTTSTFFQRALLWHGTPASAIDISPAGASNAVASAIAGDQIVGSYTMSIPNIGTVTHAIVWDGLGATFLDLNPPGAAVSNAIATSGDWQVGDASGFGGSGDSHAVEWHGSSDSAVDLQLLLPSNFRLSQANGVDASGNVVGTAYDSDAGQYRAVLWLAPEPNTALLLLIPAASTLVRQRR